MSTFIGDLMFPSADKYISNGEEKTRWVNCGGLFKNESGQFSVKLTAVPTAMGENNWFRVFPPRDQQQGEQGFRKPSPAVPKQPELPEDSDIPF